MAHYYATFPGLKITRADLLFTHGISPSIAVVYAVLQDPGAAYGDFIIGNDNQALLTFKDCALDQSTVTPPMVKRGFRMRALIMDRRWKWRHVLISGRYNQRKSDATIREDTRKTYRELIEIVLQTLGETEYVIMLPTDELDAPQVDWYRQRADLQLAHLCDRIGCLIVLGLDNKIYIMPNGAGPTYPPNGLEFEPYVDTRPANLPRYVCATFAPTRFQMKVCLEAVGLDNDGAVRTIEELSYAPGGGWESQVPGIFEGVQQEEDRQLARDTVYRWYRVVNFADGGSGNLTLPVPEYTITEIDDILPLLPGLVKTADENGPQLPYVEGYFFNGDLTGENEEEGEFARWDDVFELDRDLGIVKFPYPVYKFNDDAGVEKAELFLTCAFQARKQIDAGWWEFEAWVDLDPQYQRGWGVAQVEQPESFLYVIQRYSGESPTDVEHNWDYLYYQGLLLANCYAQHYRAVPQLSMQWNGIIAYPVAGSVHVMRWKVGGGGAVTWGGKNLEYRSMSPSYSERKLRHETGRHLHL